MTGSDLISAAFIEAGILGAADPITAVDAEFGRTRLNRMLGMWSNKGVMIVATLKASYTLGTSQQIYTIGRGTSPAADFVADRPVGPGFGKGILQANLVVSNIRTPLRLLSEQEYAAVSMPLLTASIPWALYNDGAAPNSNLYLLGVPSAANTLELFTRKLLTEFADLTTDFPEALGYEEALVLSLAELLCGPYKLNVTEELRKAALNARAAIASTNSTPNRISTTDSGMPNRAQGIRGGAPSGWRSGWYP